MPDDEVTFELPERQKEDVLEAHRQLKMARDLASRLRKAGEAVPELEAKIDTLEDKLQRFKEAFDVE